MHTCEICGREGTRGFRFYAGDRQRGIPPMRWCKAYNACQRRQWRLTPREHRYYEDQM